MATSGSALGGASVLAHGGAVAPAAAVPTAVVRWLVLVAAAVAAAWLLSQGRRRSAVVGVTLAGVVASAAASPLVAVVLVAHRASVALWLGAVLAALARRAPVRGLARVAVPAAVVAALSGVVLSLLDRVRLDGLAFDRLVLAKAAALVAAAALGLLSRRRAEALVLLGATVAGSALVLLPVTPPAGRPLDTVAGDLPVAIAPQRPGLNWVRVDTDRPVLVDGVRSTTVPGATGQWAQVSLPSGRSRLRVEQVGPAWARTAQGGSVVVDAGHGAAAPLDGAECALARLDAARVRRTPRTCPSAELRDADAGALEALVGWLAHRGVAGVDVVGDGSPRSRAATAVVERARAAHHLGTTGAVVLVGVWADAARHLQGLTAPRDGLYLAPWLLSAPLLRQGAEVAPLVVLPFDPAGAAARRYLDALPAGEPATSSGYAAAGGPHGTVRVFATAPVSILPKELGHDDHDERRSWFPGGALTPVTGALPT